MSYFHFFMSDLNSSNSNFKLTNFIQGELWQKKIYHLKDKMVIPYHLYFDDWEPDNALGSHKKLNSIAACYAMFPTIPPKFYSLLENILVVQLFKSIDKKFGDSQTYLNLIKECIFLEKEGIDIEINNKKIKVHFVLGLIIGDNLGIHEILGFAVSFMANFNCVFCKVTRVNSQKLCCEDMSLLRNIIQYNLDLQSNDVSTTGIKYECIFNKIPTFHAITNFSVDIMHDMYEGVCHYDLSIILNYFLENGLFTLDALNNKKKLFDYGVTEIGNISQPIQLKHIEKNKFNMSASEMRCFVHFLPLIIGEYVPVKDKVWHFFLKLVQILDILTSKSFSEPKINLLSSLIKDHHSFYTNFFKVNLKPKHHHMVHYPMIIKHSGPLVNIWCMRTEGKHKELKAYSNAITSRINLPFSIMMKQQFILANRKFSNRGFFDKIEFGPRNSNSQFLVSNLNASFSCSSFLINTTEITIFNWAKVNGVEYKEHMVINTASINETFKLVEIKYVVSNITNDKVYLIVSEIFVEKFVSHYQSYKLSNAVSNKLYLISIDELTSLPTCKKMHKDGIFIRLKEI